MKRVATFACALLTAASLSGCVAVSMHSMHPVRIAVTDASSAAPAPNVPLSVVYDYDSYGWFYFFNTPGREAAVTNTEGVAVMNVADFRYMILLSVNGSFTSLNRQLVREGGIVTVPPYKVILSPQ